MGPALPVVMPSTPHLLLSWLVLRLIFHSNKLFYPFTFISLLGLNYIFLHLFVLYIVIFFWETVLPYCVIYCKTTIFSELHNLAKLAMTHETLNLLALNVRSKVTRVQQAMSLVR